MLAHHLLSVDAPHAGSPPFTKICCAGASPVTNANDKQPDHPRPHSSVRLHVDYNTSLYMPLIQVVYLFINI